MWADKATISFPARGIWISAGPRCLFVGGFGQLGTVCQAEAVNFVVVRTYPSSHQDEMKMKKKS
jgi:hypothetical protein